MRSKRVFILKKKITRILHGGCHMTPGIIDNACGKRGQNSSSFWKKINQNTTYGGCRMTPGMIDQKSHPPINFGNE